MLSQTGQQVDLHMGPLHATAMNCRESQCYAGTSRSACEFHFGDEEIVGSHESFPEPVAVGRIEPPVLQRATRLITSPYRLVELEEAFARDLVVPPPTAAWSVRPLGGDVTLPWACRVSRDCRGGQRCYLDLGVAVELNGVTSGGGRHCRHGH